MMQRTRQTIPEAAIPGLRVLVVEDEFMIAMLIEETLQDHDYVVIGPFNSLDKALSAVSGGLPDAALLDVNLRGEKVYPLAELLYQRGVPFVLLSGYGSDAIPADRPAWQACSKPFNPHELINTLAQQIASRATGAEGAA